MYRAMDFSAITTQSYGLLQLKLRWCALMRTYVFTSFQRIWAAFANYKLSLCLAIVLEKVYRDTNENRLIAWFLYAALLVVQAVSLGPLARNPNATKVLKTAANISKCDLRRNEIFYMLFPPAGYSSFMSIVLKSCDHVFLTLKANCIHWGD